MLGVFCLVDDKGVIHLPKLDTARVEAVLMALASKSSINMFATKGLMGDPMATPCTCS